MRRKQFLKELKFELRKRRDIEVEEVIYYYDELIQDAVEHGEEEEIFIINLGSIREITRKLIDDETFIKEVKQKNRNSVKNALGLTVKVFGYFIFSIVAFVVVVTSFSLFASGVAVVIQTIVRMFVTPPADNYGYIMLVGFITVGISMVFIAVGLSQIFFRQAKPALLSIFRKLNTLSKKEKEGN